MRADSLPRLDTPRDRHRQRQRERILDAARALFASRGFEAVTMSDVAAQAGVVRATVFNQFGSKGALVDAITEGVLDAFCQLLDNALADERTPTPDLVRALFEHMAIGIEQFHGFYRGVFREIMKIQVGLEEGGLAARANERAHARLERLLARGQQRGDLSPDFALADLVGAFMSLANGTITHWLYDAGAGALRDRMRGAAEIWLGAVAIGAPRSEPLPELFGALRWTPPLPERTTPPRRKKR
jgi:TetR/AcrR family transcriptional regulator, cholesterol catabolism regulator